MLQLLAGLVGIGLILSIFNPIFLALTIPLGVVLFLLLRTRQRATKVDDRHLGGAQPNRPGMQSVEEHPDINAG